MKPTEHLGVHLGAGQDSEIVLNPKSVRFRNPELTLLSLGIVMVYTGKQKVAVTPKSKAVTCVLCPTEQILLISKAPEYIWSHNSIALKV